MGYFGIIRIMRKKDFAKRNPGIRFITHFQDTQKEADEEMQAILSTLKKRGKVTDDSEVKCGIYFGDKEAYVLQAEICLQQ